ncbi:MAG: hypothetical protein JSW28_00605 [Thermoplasmata archaeon]|nr:MAG: hypothetical protein JSW28_00605 [Thermoplasmata archaeon]
MGLFKNLLGKDKTGSGGQAGYVERGDSPFSPRYREIRAWIESRVGPLNPNDPNLVPNLRSVLENEKRRWGGSGTKLQFSYEGPDTYITGETLKVRKQLKSIGCVWDKNRKAWVAHGWHPTQENIPRSRKWTGLEAYINKVEYRVRMGGPR